MKTTDLRTAAQQALEALERQHKDRTAYSRAKQSANATCGEFKENTLSALIESGYMQVMGNQTVEAITALRAALAQEQAEPVASLMTHVQSGDVEVVWNDDGFDSELWHETPLYATPPKRQPLTEEKIDAEWRELDGEVSTMFMRVLRKFARAIERAHGIGETK